MALECIPGVIESEGIHNGWAMSDSSGGGFDSLGEIRCRGHIRMTCASAQIGGGVIMSRCCPDSLPGMIAKHTGIAYRRNHPVNTAIELRKSGSGGRP